MHRDERIMVRSVYDWRNMKRNARIEQQENRKEIPLLVYYIENDFRARAEALATHLGVEVTKDENYAQKAKFLLSFEENGLHLIGDQLSMRGDFTHMLPRLRYDNLTHEILVKAGKLKNGNEHPVALDATAGMGEDSLLLAAAGFQVELYEYDPIIAALLCDTIERSRQEERLSDIMERMHFHEGNSVEAMRRMSQEGRIVDLILLDPMFPGKKKNSLTNKKLQMIQQFERPCEDETALLDAARSLHPQKIVIKRPIKGPFLGNVKPAYSLQGKTIRYDCILPENSGCL